MPVSSLSYVARRLLLVPPLLVGMSLLVFVLVRLVPGDPALVVLGYKATPESVAALRQAFHLDESVAHQYLRWLGGALVGDFGLDFRQNEPIGQMIRARLPVTVELTALAAAAAALAGVPLGLLAGARRGGGADRASLAVGLVGVSIPDFWLGIMLILLLSLGARLLPSSGWVAFADDPVGNVRHLVLPALTLAASRAAVLGRLTRRRSSIRCLAASSSSRGPRGFPSAPSSSDTSSPTRPSPSSPCSGSRWATCSGAPSSWRPSSPCRGSAE